MSSVDIAAAKRAAKKSSEPPRVLILDQVNRIFDLLKNLLLKEPIARQALHDFILRTEHAEFHQEVIDDLKQSPLLAKPEVELSPEERAELAQHRNDLDAITYRLAMLKHTIEQKRVVGSAYRKQFANVVDYQAKILRVYKRNNCAHTEAVEETLGTLKGALIWVDHQVESISVPKIPVIPAVRPPKPAS